MFSVWYCAALLSATTYVVQASSYVYKPNIKGWVSLHKVVATWDEAMRHCEDQGAVLMSPTTKDLLEEMKVLMESQTSYLIGTKAISHPRVFISVEGVLLEDMAVSHMYNQLNPEIGSCLSLDQVQLRVVPCTTRLPYMCYKERKENKTMTECGTFDKEYKLNNFTGSCYKFHGEHVSWSDAYLTCMAEGGYLAIINDGHEALEVSSILPDIKYYISIGLQDWSGQGFWRSIYGDTIDKIYHQWFNNKQPEEPCCNAASIHSVTKNLKSFEVSAVGPFLCEKDPNNIKFVYNDPPDNNEQYGEIY